MAAAAASPPRQPSVQALLQAAEAAAAEGRTRAQAACYAAILEQQPRHGAALAALARLWLRAGAPPWAACTIPSRCTRPAATAQQHVRLPAAAGRTDRALDCAERAVAAGADAAVSEPDTLQLLGDCRLAAGRWQPALEAYQAAQARSMQEGCPGERTRELEVCCGAALLAAPAQAEQQAGAELVLAVLQASGNRHPGALRENLRVAASRWGRRGGGGGTPGGVTPGGVTPGGVAGGSPGGQTDEGSPGVEPEVAC